jgi:hypothetical protein
MSSSSPMGSGRLSRTAKWRGAAAGVMGSGSTPSAWSRRRTRSAPKRRASPARGMPRTSPMRRRPRRARPSAVSGAMRSAATGRGASAWRVLPGFRDALSGGIGRRRGWRRGAALGPVAFSGAGAGGARLLIDRIAVASGPVAPVPLNRASAQAAPCGVGDAGADGQAEIGAVGLHLGEKRLLPPKRCAQPVRSIIRPRAAPPPPRG